MPSIFSWPPNQPGNTCDEIVQSDGTGEHSNSNSNIVEIECTVGEFGTGIGSVGLDQCEGDADMGSDDYVIGLTWILMIMVIVLTVVMLTKVILVVIMMKMMVIIVIMAMVFVMMMKVMFEKMVAVAMNDKNIVSDGVDGGSGDDEDIFCDDGDDGGSGDNEGYICDGGGDDESDGICDGSGGREDDLGDGVCEGGGGGDDCFGCNGIEQQEPDILSELKERFSVLENIYLSSI